MTPEQRGRSALFRSVVRFCKRHNYTRAVLKLEDKIMSIQHTWSPAIERRIAKKKAKKR